MVAISFSNRFSRCNAYFAYTQTHGHTPRTNAERQTTIIPEILWNVVLFYRHLLLHLKIWLVNGWNTWMHAYRCIQMRLKRKMDSSYGLYVGIYRVHCSQTTISGLFVRHDIEIYRASYEMHCFASKFSNRIGSIELCFSFSHCQWLVE